MSCEGEMLFLRPKNTGTVSIWLPWQQITQIEGKGMCLSGVMGCVVDCLVPVMFTASCDVFFMAPEFQEHGIVTEKVRVSGFTLDFFI